jgi:hypothetical protein
MLHFQKCKLVVNPLHGSSIWGSTDEESFAFSMIRNVNSVLAANLQWISLDQSECTEPIITYFLKVHFNIPFLTPWFQKRSQPCRLNFSSFNTRARCFAEPVIYIPVNTHCIDEGESIIFLNNKKSQRVDSDINLRLTFIQIILNNSIIIKTQSYATHVQVYYVSSFGFVNKLWSGVLLIKTIQRKMSLHKGYLTCCK